LRYNGRMLQVTEIFKSIQGESSHAGRPCAFVRLTGCRWCDTEYAFHGGRAMTRPQVLEAVEAFGLDLVEITGGEPLLQPAVHSLMQDFLDRRYTVLLETGGSLPLDGVPAGVHIIMDLKAPGSGETHHNRFENLQRLTFQDEVKCVVKDRADYEWFREILSRHRLDRFTQVLLSPVFGQLELRDLAEWVLADGLPVRLQTQLHKHIWGRDAIGV